MHGNWESLGLVYEPNMHSESWARHNATLPTPYVRANGILRIYIGMGDPSGVSRIGFVDMNPQHPEQVLATSSRPVLDIGRPGCFDDNGVVPIQVFPHAGTLWMTYVGFQLGTQVPYTLFSGFAISHDDGETFTRISEVPTLDRTEDELFFRTAPHVLRDQGVWKFWYIGGSRWFENSGKLLPIYDLRYLESAEFPPPSRKPGQILMAASGGIHGFGRPVIQKRSGGAGLDWEMYYSARLTGSGYRLMRAQSEDGKNWTDHQELFTNSRATRGDWESEATCFGYPLETASGKVLYYNGNQFGRTGFGLAIEGDREAR